MNTPFDHLCGMQCIVGEQRCPAFDVCPVNKAFTRTIFMRYFNCCRRSLKYHNDISLDYSQIEHLVRSCLITGFVCPVCGITMEINNGQTILTDGGENVYSLEHIVSMSKGGLNVIENMTICCRKCNQDNNEKDQEKE